MTKIAREPVDTQSSASSTDPLFYDVAPPEALASLERGLEQIANGQTISLEEALERLRAAAKPVAKP